MQPPEPQRTHPFPPQQCHLHCFTDAGYLGGGGGCTSRHRKNGLRLLITTCVILAKCLTHLIYPTHHSRGYNKAGAYGRDHAISQKGD